MIIKKSLAIFGILLLYSCKTNSIDSIKETASSELVQPNEPYFKAQGNEPFWSVEISGTDIRFKGIEKENYFNAPHVEPIRAMDANVKRYIATTEKGTIQITISQNECIDRMSGIIYNYNVVVELTTGNANEPIIHNGCGAYSIDYRLNDIWILEKMDGKSMVENYFLNNLPMLEINSKMANFTGFGGCNRIRGSLFQENELLRFTNLLTSKMTCGPKNKEDQFLKALQSSTTYEIKDNRLYLSNPDGIKVVFKKVD